MLKPGLRRERKRVRDQLANIEESELHIGNASVETGIINVKMLRDGREAEGPDALTQTCWKALLCFFETLTSNTCQRLEMKLQP